MNKHLLKLALILFTTTFFAQTDRVKVESNSEGKYLTVNNKKFMINGVNWDYIPIGTNTVNADFWNKPDDVIRAGLDTEMSLLKNMNVNVIRQYTGVPARWIKYIYENYGIYTMLNHSFGRYGLTLNGVWTPVTIYDDPTTEEHLLNDIKTLVQEYKNTPGLLLYLLGNENNYGLFWAGAETEDFPDDEGRINFIGESRGRPMYRLMNTAAKMMKEMDASHPVAICNGDVLFIDIVADECKDVDIYGVNCYRGPSFTDMFDVVKKKFDKPIMFTEFGADAFNAIENKEDQKSQAYYMVENWREIYANAAGLGKAENSIGGFTFQFSDGWWKYGFDNRENADVHDTNASWANGGYSIDLAPGENNMNEEWFGICAKGPTSPRGLYELYPRAAYYALKEAHQLNPYEDGVDADFIQNYFNNINLMDAVLRARGDKAALEAKGGGKIKLSNLRAEFTTFSTGGSLITTPKTADPNSTVFPDELGFDHMQSFYIGVEGNPAPNMHADVNFNVIGNVASNPINEIFYENRGRPVSVRGEDGDVVTIPDINRLQVYSAEYEWKTKQADVRGFYRTGHYHWGYEGDFFGLYPEANYGPNLDIYQGEILGMEIDGHRAFKGFKAAFGPQLWWGANPAFLVKYSTHLGHWGLTGLYHEDVDNAGAAVSSIAIPMPKTRRATLHVEREMGSFKLEAGGIWGGQPLNGREFQYVTGSPGNYTVYDDEIGTEDNWGAKAKITYQKGKFNWYALGATAGLVANGGYDQTRTFTGWKLKDNGSGNQNSFLTGFAYTIGNVQIAPNFLWQEPLVDAIPNDAPAPARLRNIQDDPFAVRANRKTTAGEILFTYDPTPGSWFYEWDNDRSEDAKLAFNLGFVYRHLPTTMDAAIGFFENSRIGAPFGNSAPAEDLWEAHSRIVSKVSPDLALIGNLYVGNGQANGDDKRVIERIGGDIRLIYKKWKVEHSFKIDDWGPYDYHRDFNLTFPVQLMLDISTSLGKPDWFILPDTKIGLRGTWRSLNEFSPRYSPNAAIPNTFPPEPRLSSVGFDDGQEWEIRTYVHINIGK
ncbi:glycoside hydrolase family 2 TIM barrel-domain containing protein [Tamlana flava]|uniref:glycoside hydrolase family 2 TIM barrel-domain containing protein n=1 Tax=Tamlana flava TaxID=3158572 RepID=UPI00351B0E57